MDFSKLKEDDVLEAKKDIGDMVSVGELVRVESAREDFIIVKTLRGEMMRCTEDVDCEKSTKKWPGIQSKIDESKPKAATQSKEKPK